MRQRAEAKVQLAKGKEKPRNLSQDGYKARLLATSHITRKRTAHYLAGFKNAEHVATMQVLAHIAYYASKSSHRARCDISKAARPTRESDTQFVDIVETIIIRFLEALGDNQIDKLCCESNSTPTQADGELSNCPTKA